MIRRRICLLFAATLAMTAAGPFAQADQPVLPVVRHAAADDAETPQTEPAETAETADETTDTTSAPVVEEAPDLRPRVELYVPSTSTLADEARRSHASTIAHAFAGLLGGGSADEEAVGMADLHDLAEQILGWPNTSIMGALYAPDVEGRPRFALHFDYNVDKFKQRLDAVLSHQAAKNAFKGLEITPRDEGGYAFVLTELVITAGYLIGDDDGCWFVSHDDMELPERVWGQPAGDKTPKNQRLLYCRYNMAGTEKDTGSVFGDLALIRSLNYWCQVNKNGAWNEQFAVVLPGGSAAAVQGVFTPIENHFRVPSEALAYVVLGFSWEMMIDGMVQLPYGTLDFAGKDETCICVLPGNGFLPVPDIVVQSRIRKADDFLESLDKAADKINNRRERDEQKRLWFKEDIDGRKAYWRQAESGSIYNPFVYRQVLFVQDIKGDEGEDQHLMILGMTSTTPRRFVERWTAARPADEMVTVPTKEKLDAQGFIHWKSVYKLVAPYVNMAASLTEDAKFLPSTEEIEKQLVDSEIDVQLVVPGMDEPASKPSFLKTHHTGPVPLGAFYVPMITGIAAAPSRLGDTDLARERVAVRNLRVLYKHCKLFKKDYGRWPAEMWELDGYVDFAGNPQLLHLPKSMKARFSSWFGLDALEDAANPDDDEKEDDGFYGEEDDRPDLSLYVIRWGEDDWTLGYRDKALDHLDALYIDQDGKIHRVAKHDNGKKKDKDTKDEPADDDTKVSALD